MAKFMDFIGGVGPAFLKKQGMSGLFGKEGETEQLDTKTDQQKQQLNDYFSNPIQDSQLYGTGQDYLQGVLGNGPNAFAGFQSPYMQNFQQQILPQISERFAGMGTGSGALNSSALNQTLGMAGSTLQNNLAQLRAQMQQGAAGQALQYAQQPYSNQLGGIGQNMFENLYKAPTNGIGPKLIGAGVGGLAGFFTGGPAGAAIGAASGFQQG